MKSLNTGMNKGVGTHPHGKAVPKGEEWGFSDLRGVGVYQERHLPTGLSAWWIRDLSNQGCDRETHQMREGQKKKTLNLQNNLFSKLL